jgi:hypothetical protein
VRRLTLVAAALAALAAVAAASAQNRGTEREQLRSADMQAARASLLRRTDLRTGWTAKKPSRDSHDTCPGWHPDFSRYVITGKAHGEWQHPSGIQIDSALDLFVSPTQAAADFRLAAKGLSRCRRYKMKQSKDGPVTLKPLVARINPWHGFGERSLRLELVEQVIRDGHATTVYVEGIGFQQGRSIGFVMLTSAGHPMRGVEVLARIMLARVGA